MAKQCLSSPVHCELRDSLDRLARNKQWVLDDILHIYVLVDVPQLIPHIACLVVCVEDNLQDRYCLVNLLFIGTCATYGFSSHPWESITLPVQASMHPPTLKFDASQPSACTALAWDLKGEMRTSPLYLDA